MTEQEVLEYCAKVMRSKGYDPTANVDVGDIFIIQKDGWISTFEKYRLGSSEDRRSDVLKGFAARQVIGGAGKILEAFTAYLAGRAAQDQPGPDWSARGPSRCGFCNNSGIVSEVPVASATGRFVGVRLYSFACVCDLGRRFPGTKIAEEWMLQFARIRAGQEAERLRQWRRANDIDSETLGEFIPKFREWLKKQGDLGGMFVRASKPKVKPRRDIDTRVLDEVKPMKRLEAPKEEPTWTEADDEILNTL